MTTDTDPWNPANLLPLSVLTAEGFGDGSINTLADKLGDAVILDDVGIRCTTRATARALIAERSAQQAQAQARDDAHHERMRELDQRNRAQRRGGAPATPGSNAHADLIRDDE